MNKHKLAIAFSVLGILGLQPGAGAQLLGTAEHFAVLAGSAVTSTGATTISGDLGVWPGTAVTGFPPGIITNGSLHAGDAIAMHAQADALIAFNYLAAEIVNKDLTGQDLGGMILFPGVYEFSSSAFLTGALTLDAVGDPNARFDFLIGSTLISSTNSSLHYINGGSAANTYWQVGSSATLGTGSELAGHLVAAQSITFDTGASLLNGSALALNGAVTLDNNQISNATPEPSSLVGALAGIGMMGLLRRRR